MKTPLLLFLSALFACSLPAAGTSYTRDVALAQLQASYKGSSAVFVGKLEMRGKQRVLVCVEVIKARDGKPRVGEEILVEAPLPVFLEGVIFMPNYPSRAFNANVRLLDKGRMRECPELSRDDIIRALRKPPAEASPAPATVPKP